MIWSLKNPIKLEGFECSIYEVPKNCYFFKTLIENQFDHLRKKPHIFPHLKCMQRWFQSFLFYSKKFPRISDFLSLETPFRMGSTSGNGCHGRTGIVTLPCHMHLAFTIVKFQCIFCGKKMLIFCAPEPVFYLFRSKCQPCSFQKASISLCWLFAGRPPFPSGQKQSLIMQQRKCKASIWLSLNLSSRLRLL